MEDGVAGAPPSNLRFGRDISHVHDHCRKCSHESSRLAGDRGPSDGGQSVVHAQGPVLGMERSDAVRILATPRLGISFCERSYFSKIVHAPVSGMVILLRS